MRRSVVAVALGQGTLGHSMRLYDLTDPLAPSHPVNWYAKEGLLSVDQAKNRALEFRSGAVLFCANFRIGLPNCDRGLRKSERKQNQQ